MGAARCSLLLMGWRKRAVKWQSSCSKQLDDPSAQRRGFGSPALLQAKGGRHLANYVAAGTTSGMVNLTKHATLGGHKARSRCSKRTQQVAAGRPTERAKLKTEPQTAKRRPVPRKHRSTCAALVLRGASALLTPSDVC